MGNIVKKILVANRGEIALRVVRTAREMGISTVAVYSEQDRNAQYVQLADESYLLSGDTYASTYLNEDLLIGILHRSGANAVHPGYGFLSEVPSFADKVEKAGAIWVGPHPQALIDLGDKITARRVAKSAQVPPVPGISGARAAHAAGLLAHVRLPGDDEAHRRRWRPRHHRRARR